MDCSKTCVMICKLFWRMWNCTLKFKSWATILDVSICNFKVIKLWYEGVLPGVTQCASRRRKKWRCPLGRAWGRCLVRVSVNACRTPHLSRTGTPHSVCRISLSVLYNRNKIRRSSKWPVLLHEAWHLLKTMVLICMHKKL